MASDPRVDAYISGRPADQQRLLSKLRADLARLVPESEESISYDMPAVKVDGRFFVSDAGWTKHCTIYPIDDALLERHAAALQGYTHTKGGLHFTAEKPLPDAVLEDIVRVQVGRARSKGPGRS